MAPGESVQTDAQILNYLRDTATTVYHPVGTCKMGIDALAVVHPKTLKVIGVDNLRVMDASIMPNIISGNLNATTIMLAEKIVDKMRGVQLPRSTADYYVANGAPLRSEPMRDYLSTV